MISLTEYFWVYRFVNYLFNFYEYCILAYILSSWFPQFRNNVIVEFLEKFCEPFLKIFRKLIPPFGILDISPIIAFIALDVLRRLLLGFIFA
ncbi:YggT family protein [Gemella bergeri]|uniref:YggT family protein n=1 Tax=Gemella bergeri TaxID=84136 RepID=UPI000417042C|nr:YggT family protein [Gemella bergeri]